MRTRTRYKEVSLGRQRSKQLMGEWIDGGVVKQIFRSHYDLLIGLKWESLGANFFISLWSRATNFSYCMCIQTRNLTPAYTCPSEELHA